MPRKVLGPLALMLVVAGCSKGEDEAAKKAISTTKAFKLQVEAPKAAKVGQVVAASISLTPLGEYKVNMEYPLKLTVNGPADATPKQVVMQAKDAKTMSKAGVLLRPEAKLARAGVHKFVAELKFSVCTEKQCELLREQLSWEATVE